MNLDLFGNELKPLETPVAALEGGASDDYLLFLKKFEKKKTTDDCYTPPKIYRVVLDWVFKNCEIPENPEVIRPFYPGGDYLRESYKPNTVVIDNPPFSILSKITRHYLERNIKFFLFAPHLTLIGSNQDFTAVVVGAALTYENGAKVSTSFLTNMLGDLALITAPDLRRLILEADKKPTNPPPPKYKYPANVITSTLAGALAGAGVSFSLKRNERLHIRELQSQKRAGKAIFGSGYLVSDPTAARWKEAWKEKRRREQEREREREQVIEWGLSEVEELAILELNKTVENEAMHATRLHKPGLGE